MHAVEPVEPAYFPAAQSVQVEAPAEEYFPALHVLQNVDPMASEALPAAQSVQSEAPEELYLPIAQSVQEVALVTLVYFPEGQLSQVDTPPMLYVPAVQAVQPVDADVPTDLEPAAQDVHVDWLVKAVYEPPGQAAHDDCPLKL